MTPHDGVRVAVAWRVVALALVAAASPGRGPWAAPLMHAHTDASHMAQDWLRVHLACALAPHTHTTRVPHARAHAGQPGGPRRPAAQAGHVLAAQVSVAMALCCHNPAHYTTPQQTTHHPAHTTPHTPTRTTRAAPPPR
jgi:hypothetical protein